MSPILATGSGADRQPRFARNDERGNRFYTWGDPPESFYSVTTIIGGGVPKHLVAWAVKLVAELAYADVAELLGFVGSRRRRGARALALWERKGRLYVQERQAAGELTSIKLDKLTAQELALRYLKGEPDRIRDAAAKRGIDVHSEAEALVLEKAHEATQLVIAGEDLPVWPDDIAAHMGSFVSWVNDWRPEFHAAEATVFHRAQAYAGTLDAIIRIRFADLIARLERTKAGVPSWIRERRDWPEWVLVIVDYKSGREIYADVALQLAAYARGEFIGSPDRVTEIAVPQADLGAVLHLTPKGYAFRPVRIDEPVWMSFLYAREVFRWALELSKTVLGPELEHIEEVA